jgi:hypothetical protein
MAKIKYLHPMTTIPAKAVDTLVNILDELDIPSIVITRTISTPAEQARIMYENIEAHGVKAAYELYANAGDEVIRVYEQQKALGSSADYVVAAMTTKIQELGPGKVSKHCIIDPHKSVFDIAPSSIPVDKKEGWEIALALCTGFSKVLKPPDDPAYHIEMNV